MIKPLPSILSRTANRLKTCRVGVALVLGATGSWLLEPSPLQAAEPRATTIAMRSLNRFEHATTPPLPETTTPNDRLKPISEVALPLALPARLPAPDFAQERFGAETDEYQVPGTSRQWPMRLSTWEAPALCHRPLYFEDENLERHGYSFGLMQPAVSATHFAGRAATLPYLMGAYPKHECVYTLGKGKPGSYMPYYLHRPPVSARGAVYQAGAVAGLSWFVP